MEQLTVQSTDIKNHTPCIGSVVHPVKGRILFATKAIAIHSVIAELQMKDLKLHSFQNIKQFEEFLNSMDTNDARKCIEHSIPTGNGDILTPDSSHWNNYLNHSMSPNVHTKCEYYTKSQWELVAIKEIDIGDELCINYDQATGYEIRQNEPIINDFLKICQQYDVEKRPSKLTIPPVKVMWKN